MDHESLRTAAGYLNNLLLARGLLRNGEPIDFVKPSRDARAQIINLVHDLVLREDRDREQREQVAVTLRGLRADGARKTAEIEQLRTAADADARRAVQARAAQNAAEAEAKKVERAMKSVQEQAARLKTNLAHVKAQCQNDLRKRDLELARLKTHLHGQQRGAKVGTAAPSITIAGRPRGRQPAGSDEELPHDVQDPEYTLKQETTEFLTQLSQSLSDENDGLIGVIRGALDTLRELLGLSAHASRPHPDSAVGGMASTDDGKIGGGSGGGVAGGGSNGGDLVQALPTSYETLAADMDSCLAHLKTILSNPNFVSIDEVEVREEEITRLREGWDRMEARWKDVLLMMESWRRRMDTGDTINIDDLRKGMGLVTPGRDPRLHGLREEDEASEPSFISDGGDVSAIKLPGVSEEEEQGADEPSLNLEPPPSRSDAQRRRKDSLKRRRDVLSPPAFFDLRPPSHAVTPSSPRLRSNPEPVEAAAGEGEGESSGDGDEFTDGPAMTVEEKLHEAEREAEVAAAAAARHAAKAKAAATGPISPAKRSVGVSFGAGDVSHTEDDTLGQLVAPSPMARRTKIRGRPKKRKSTLSPEELEALMGVE